MRDLNEDLDDQFRDAVDRYALRPADSKWDALSGKIISNHRPSAIADTFHSKYRKWMITFAFLLLVPVGFIFVRPALQGFDHATAKKTEEADQKHATKSMPSTRSRTSDAQNSATVTLQHISSAQAQSVNPVSVQRSSSAQTPSVSDKLIWNSGTVQDNQPDAGFSEPSTRVTTVELAVSDQMKLKPIYPKTDVTAFLPLQHLDRPHRQGFYLGLVGGPLFTEVKNQGFKKPGFDLGLLAGYTLSKKISLETGLLYVHQYYCVSGKYYNDFAGIHYAAGLEGSRSAFEIPLTIKYNLIRRAGGNFFISAGASTFVGVNDKVVIQVAEGTVPPSAHFDYGVTSYLPSYVNISVGYEYKIGKSADIRLEPYVQIPLNSNTGNSFKTESSGGSIQVLNAGIHIGISRFIR